MEKPSSWEDRIASAISFGGFISWREISAYTDGLSSLQAELNEYSKHKPSDALLIFEIFIAACLVKAGEVDGSRDNLSVIVDDLFLGWTRAAGESGMSGEEFIRKINHWMNVDDYGYCYDLETKIIPALNQNFTLALQKSLENRKANGDQKSDKFPLDSAQIYVAHALLILNEKHSKAYHHAHDYLDMAKALMEQSGDSPKWEQLVIDIRKEHRLKSSFMPGFNQIVEGRGAPRDPTCRERIQSKSDRG